MSQPKETAQTEQQALSPTEEAAAPQQKAAPAPSAQQKPASNPPQQIAVPESELKVEIVKEGAGTGAKSGDSLSVHYTGTFLNGTKFDSSRDRGIPFTFTLGAGQVILGWDVGLEGMRIGEARKLTVPPQYGYGSVGTPGGPIPPNATLLFEVELLGITSS
ncbi:MAG: FKBP-type peptidyl-prolyl cis-trans isomerase [Candidatus Wildermuthbacteria bacterium]|nr:FKBP-type peptidyl-prolyl cis-trans isomerase [Candidatus Wildermuthbacteria bacterium]